MSFQSTIQHLYPTDTQLSTGITMTPKTFTEIYGNGKTSLFHLLQTANSNQIRSNYN